ncbi:type II toxin-antitoxin system HigA family antitoxin [Altericista sp. CCNU0014]|uniref:helix-turn-helix domain-containing protein n=1 Tax=Altericista sp. CCNU0014 TaxID=3082949 RepID=UPI00384D0D26
MTLTFNREAYAELLARYQPQKISSDNENEKAIELAEKLSHSLNRTPEEDALLDLLTTLIEKFEDENHPIPVASPLEMLKHLMEARELIQEDLVGVIGSRGVVSEVMNGKRGISNAQAKALGDFFSVEPSLFLAL